ncbi:MAG: hypothetical protein MUC63_06645, partial [Planctomycetes bacterium]|nr:hypothetical protein [Planctomycetota bacterium]
MDAGGPPGYAAVFDDRPLKAFAGLSGSVRLEDRSFSASAGLKAYAAPWLDFEASVPWKWAQGHDHEENCAIETSGVGDLSLSAAFDVLELANPSLVLKRCDDEGKKVWVPTDHFRFVKNP